jgi:hypothetical protein
MAQKGRFRTASQSSTVGSNWRPSLPSETSQSRHHCRKRVAQAALHVFGWPWLHSSPGQHARLTADVPVIRQQRPLDHLHVRSPETKAGAGLRLRARTGWQTLLRTWLRFGRLHPAVPLQDGCARNAVTALEVWFLALGQPDTPADCRRAGSGGGLDLDDLCRLGATRALCAPPCATGRAQLLLQLRDLAFETVSAIVSSLEPVHQRFARLLQLAHLAPHGLQLLAPLNFCRRRLVMATIGADDDDERQQGADQQRDGLGRQRGRHHAPCVAGCGPRQAGCGGSEDHQQESLDLSYVRYIYYYP